MELRPYFTDLVGDLVYSSTEASDKFTQNFRRLFQVIFRRRKRKAEGRIMREGSAMHHCQPVMFQQRFDDVETAVQLSGLRGFCCEVYRSSEKYIGPALLCEQFFELLKGTESWCELAFTDHVRDLDAGQSR